jgi:site-specific DNA-methyltransferase (adenine-specific)
MSDFLDNISERVTKHHKWEKSVAEASHLIEKFTKKGNVVVDPYCGSGSFLLAAKELSRKYVGTEIDAKSARIARKRLSET